MLAIRTPTVSIGTDSHTFIMLPDILHLYSSVILFESLYRLGCKPDRLMMYPSEFSTEDKSTEAILLRKARDEYKVILKPIEAQRRYGSDSESEDHLSQMKMLVALSITDANLRRCATFE